MNASKRPIELYFVPTQEGDHVTSVSIPVERVGEAVGLVINAKDVLRGRYTKMTAKLWSSLAQSIVASYASSEANAQSILLTEYEATDFGEALELAVSIQAAQKLNQEPLVERLQTYTGYSRRRAKIENGLARIGFLTSLLEDHVAESPKYGEALKQGVSRAYASMGILRHQLAETGELQN